MAFERKKRAGLRQVCGPSKGNTGEDVNVVAIHGLDTDSTSTWTWILKSQEDSEENHRDSHGESDDEGDEERVETRRQKKLGINWLRDKRMLPHRIPTAQIFTYDWPAELFYDHNTIQMTITELARRFLLNIKSRLITDSTRPILFIASCLGGIILTEAMTIAAKPGSEYNSIWKATRGIVFLGTPFRGTAFGNITKAAVRALDTYARLQGKHVTILLDNVQKSNAYLEDLVGDFTQICQGRNPPCHLAIFYEMEKGNLWQKVVNRRIADIFHESEPLVNSSSARLDMVPNPIALERRHVLMNKFYGPQDPTYDLVCGQIEIIICEMLKTQPIVKASTWLRTTHHSMRNLGIERLSGDRLSMDQYYIDLVIIKQHANTHTNEQGPSSSTTLSQTSEEITLQSLFEGGDIGNSQKRSRRILIYGRAGVGKTTLCKKIVYEFTYGELWKDLFDHVLWVPLRNLRLEGRRGSPKYTYKNLFYQEYFSQHKEGEKLAEALQDATMGAGANKILFILDGLDEVSQDINSSTMKDFLDDLLGRPNVIITSRPNANTPRNIDLKLEAIGFNTSQIDAYIQGAFTDQITNELDSEKMEGVQSFLKHHPLVRSLVCNPVHLDAICCSWDDSFEKDVQQTMTSIYENIEYWLWKKDLIDLIRQSPNRIEEINKYEAYLHTKNENHILQILAFSGMYSSIIEFDLKHRIAVSRYLTQFKDDIYLSVLQRHISLDGMLGRISFFRSSDSSHKANDRNYHFLHLTFQEYFGARYFVRKLVARKLLEFPLLGTGQRIEIDPTEFLTRNKYNPRYNIFWRFVAGLLDAEGEAPLFFEIVEAEPRDILGIAHQRLIMHCMNEVSAGMLSRESLEDHLLRWITFEFNLPFHVSKLSIEAEFPINALKKAFQQVPTIKADILMGFEDQAVLESLSISRQVLDFIASCFKDEDEKIREMSLNVLRGKLEVSEAHLQAIVACLKDDSPTVRTAALRALEGKQVSNDHLQTIVSYLEDDDFNIRGAAFEALRGQQVSKGLLQAIVACLKNDDNWRVRTAALSALEGRQVSKDHIEAIVACLKDNNYFVRLGALKALQDKPVTEDHLLDIVACLKDNDRFIRVHASEALKDKPITEDCLRHIVPYLEDESDLVRDTVRKVLTGRPPLPEEIRRAIEVIEMREDQPDSTVIVARLTNKNENVRGSAVTTLRKHSTLPNETLRDITTCFEDKDEGVRAAAIQALKSQHTLPDEILRAIAACLKDEFRKVRMAAIKVLRKQPTLPSDILQDIAACLEDEDEDVKAAAIKVFEGQHTLSDGILRTIIACYEDTDEPARIAALKVLISRRLLSSVPNRLMKSFYDAMLRLSFEQHVTWQVADKTSYIMLDNEEYSEVIPDQVVSAIWNAQIELDVPYPLRIRPHWALGNELNGSKKRPSSKGPS